MVVVSPQSPKKPPGNSIHITTFPIHPKPPSTAELQWPKSKVHKTTTIIENQEPNNYGFNGVLNFTNIDVLLSLKSYPSTPSNYSRSSVTIRQENFPQPRLYSQHFWVQPTCAQQSLHLYFPLSKLPTTLYCFLC